MFALEIPYHGISPVLFDFGYFSIRWYGLAYATGLMLGWLYIRRLVSNASLWPNRAPMRADNIDDLLIWIALGVILGGRLGHAIFYEPGSYLADPTNILKIWQGGMSFHGGLLGTIAAIILFARRNGFSIFSTGDLVSAAVPIGLFFGRIANFINGELFGRPTDLPWSMRFPLGNGQWTEPRHPSQLYEAMLEGLIIFILLRFMIYNRQALGKPGLVSGIFLLTYAVGRSISEHFREPEVGHAFNWGPFTAGIVYSIPMALFGIYLIVNAMKQKKAVV